MVSKQWQREALEMWRAGRTWKEITEAIRSKYFPELEFLQVRDNKVRYYIRGTEEYKGKQGVKPKPEKLPKVEVIQNHEPAQVEARWKGHKTIKFGLIGDTHINSVYAQLTHLHGFYKECERQEIANVYHAGDIDEGEKMRPGHAYECYTQGADAHVEEICKVFPKIDGMDTYFILGNHDASVIKHCGHDIGKAITDRRKDLHYLGRDCAVVHLTPNCTMELRHNWDGSAYAISYKPQKNIDSMSGGEKPNILALGHYHKAEYLFYRNIHCFQVGTFQAQTNFMRGKGLAANMGGWIVKVKVDDEGTIKRIKPEFIPFYKAIKDDYKGWR